MTLQKSLIAAATVLSIGLCFADDGAYAQNSRQPVAVSLSAQNDQAMQQNGGKMMFRQGQDPLAESMQGMYNAPARIDVTGKWDVNVSGSFIYWNPFQDGMDVAVEGVMNAAKTSFNQTPGKIVSHSSHYKPGFKVDFGFATPGFDNWTFNAQYTWLHSKTETTHGNTKTANALQGFNARAWFPNQLHTAALGVSSEWDFHFQMLDVVGSRPYYSGRRLTVAPYGGLRALWLKQKFDVEMVNVLSWTPNGAAAGTPASRNITSHNESNSWGLGPIGGMSCDWMLGRGFTFASNMAAGILYTRYTSLHNSYNKVNGSQVLLDSTNANLGPVGVKENEEFNALRPFFEVGLGVAYGTYFYNNDYYINFKAMYDFMVFANQNMLRRTVDIANRNTSFAPGDMWMQGLTVTASFVF